MPDEMPGPQKSKKFLSSWWVTGMLGILGLVAVLMATGVIAGIEPVAIKPATMTYPTGADKGRLSLFVQPPLSKLNRDDQPPQLFVQWTNRANGNLPMPELQAAPDRCFELERKTPLPRFLGKGETRIIEYLLHVKDDCPEQAPLAIVSVPTVGAGMWGQPETELVVTTSPIVITSGARLKAERLVHILSSLAAPIVLALLALLIDRYQKRREQAQKYADDERELAQQTLQRRLEVWKLVFPIIDGYIRRHYVLISRQMDLIRAEMSQQPVNERYLMAEVVILRAAFDRLGDEVGGFSFQDSSAEEICSILSNHIFYRLEGIAGDRPRYSRSCRAVTPLDLASEADDKLTLLAQGDGAMAQFHQEFASRLAAPAVMEELRKLLGMTIQFLDFENNLLWYPWWYHTAPMLDFSQTFNGLGLGAEKAARLQALLKSLEREVPEECRSK